jgi:SOS-response transcriptional repressor LexA
MKTTGDLIRQLRKTAKITQKQLAIALGITREAVSLWETGSTKPSGESLVALARYFGRNESEFLEEDQINNIDRIISINPNEKLYEFGTENEKLFKAKEPTADYNISKPMKYVPLLISEQVAQWMESKNKTDITGISQWQATTAQTGNNSFALKVTDRSMHNPSGSPSIPFMSTIIVDPDGTPNNGNIVVVSSTHSSELIVKKLVIDGSNKYLEPLNPDYKLMVFDESFKIIGVVRQVVQDL